MAYRVILPPRVQKQLDGLSSGMRDRVALTVAGLADDPRPHGSRKLVDVDAWRVRVGDYRIIYRIDDAGQVVKVAWIGLRKDAYRGN